MRRHCREATMSNGKTWKRYHKYIILYVLFVLLGACTSLTSTIDEKGVLKRGPSDRDIFNQGMTYLGNQEQAADYAKARSTFDKLLKGYPDSKWRNISGMLIRLIDDIESCKEKSNAEILLLDKAKEEKAKLLRENEQLKKESRRLLEETVKFVQENDQLKKDIERLKSLEVQLEKREKMLR
jgi:hypothetical protein